MADICIQKAKIQKLKKENRILKKKLSLFKVLFENRQRVNSILHHLDEKKHRRYKRKYRLANNVKKYRSDIHAKKYIMNRKLAAIAKEVAVLKSKAEADLITMMMGIMKIKNTKMKVKNM